MIFKTNNDCNGKIDRYKARFIAKGFMQSEGIDYTETFHMFLQMSPLESWT